MEIGNDFSQLDAQSTESHFAQFTPEEHAEIQGYLDSISLPVTFEPATEFEIPF